MDIEADRRNQRGMMKQLSQRQHEIEKQEMLQKEARRREDRIIERERQKYEEFKHALNDELQKVNEVKERLNESQLYRIQRHSSELQYEQAEEARKLAREGNWSI
jgi:arginine utilization protein RocB